MGKETGDEELREQPPVKSGVQSFDGTAKTRGDHKVLSGGDKGLPTSYRHAVPDGLQSFNDKGQTAGGTKYLGWGV